MIERLSTRQTVEWDVKKNFHESNTFFDTDMFPGKHLGVICLVK